MSEIVSNKEDEDVPVIEDVEPTEGAPIKRDEMAQKDYYDKWNKFTAEELDALDDEEKAAKEANDRALGKDRAFNSEAEKKDRTTHEALKEAKKLWDKRRAEELDAKFVLEGRAEGETITVNAALLGNKRVLTVKGLKGCKVALPRTLGNLLVKVFVEQCEGCTLNLACPLITSHVEASHCKDLTVYVAEALHTLQVDLSSKVRVVYEEGVFGADHKIYSAGCLDLSIEAKQAGGKPPLVSRNDYIADLAPMVPYTGAGGGKDTPTTAETHGSADADADSQCP